MLNKKATIVTTPVYDHEYHQYVPVPIVDEKSIDEVNHYGAQGYEIVGNAFPIENDWYFMMKATQSVASLPLEYIKGCINSLIEEKQPKTRRWTNMKTTITVEDENYVAGLKRIAEMLDIDLEG